MRLPCEVRLMLMIGTAGVFMFAQPVRAQGGDTARMRGPDTLARHRPTAESFIPRKAPVLACADEPQSPVNYLSIHVETTCATCTANHQDVTAWGTTASASSNAGAHLNPSSTAVSAIGCGKNGTRYRISLTGTQRILAGWDGGYPGNYMSSESKITDAATTGFWVPSWTWNHYCLRTTARDGKIVATKGYPGSHDFNAGTFPLDAIALEDPAGKHYPLTNGAVVQLKPAGFWKLSVNFQKDYTSGWAENSGNFDISDLAEFTISRCGRDVN